ncbi:MAG: hypothetical protein JJU36_04805 [Phycisphaeraceae bacterium]|nr:hypothetical protein [Phycisphaeraceae bacterium]
MFRGFTSAAIALAIAAPASALPIEQRTFTFTAADLFNQVFVEGPDGSTAADNGVFSGARLLRVGSSGTHADVGRTYVDSQIATFQSRWNQYAESGYGLYTFSLWGLNNNGGNWGEDYKPYEWISFETPEGWNTSFLDAQATWPGWYADDVAPFGPYTSLRPDFTVDGMSFMIPLDADPMTLSSLEFSVTIAFNPNDAFWGQDTKGAPNDLDGPMTFWFGGYIAGLVETPEGAAWDTHLYEGNMVLRSQQAGEPIPEPVTGTLALGGLIALGCYATRRRRA